MKKSNLKICFDRIIPKEVANSKKHQAYIAAALHGTKRTVNPKMGIAVPLMAIQNNKMWPAGFELKCRFIGGKDLQRAKVMDIAKEWTQYANIKIIFVNTKDEHVRIDFMEGGSWSAVGTDCVNPEYFHKDSPTMNLFDWLDAKKTPADQWRQAVLP